MNVNCQNEDTLSLTGSREVMIYRLLSCPGLTVDDRRWPGPYMDQIGCRCYLQDIPVPMVVLRYVISNWVQVIRLTWLE